MRVDYVRRVVVESLVLFPDEIRFGINVVHESGSITVLVGEFEATPDYDAEEMIEGSQFYYREGEWACDVVLHTPVAGLSSSEMQFIAKLVLAAYHLKG